MSVLILIGTGTPQGNFLLYETVRENLGELESVVILGTPRTEDANKRLREAILAVGRVHVDAPLGALPAQAGRPALEALRPDDLRHNYLYTTELLRRLAPAIVGRRVVLGYLGGTKAMALGVILAAEDALGSEIAHLTLATLDPRTGRSDLVTVQPEGGLSGPSSRPSLPTSRPLGLLMALAGVEGPRFDRLDASRLTEQATRIAWSVWGTHPWTTARLLYRGLPYGPPGLGAGEYLRALFPGCDPGSLEDSLTHAVDRENDKRRKRGSAPVPHAPGSMDWGEAMEQTLSALAPLASAAPRPAETTGGGKAGNASEIAVEAFWNLARICRWPVTKAVVRSGVRRWFQQGGEVPEGPHWGRVFLERCLAIPVHGDGPCTPTLPSDLPYGVPTGDVRIDQRADLRIFSLETRQRLQRQLAAELDVFALGGQPRAGLIYEAAVGVALCDATRDLPIDVYTSSGQVRGIELDFVLVGPANRVQLVEAKSSTGYPDRTMDSWLRRDQEATVREAVRQHRRLPKQREGTTGTVKPQQHNAQLEVAAALSGDREASVAYALPGNCSAAQQAKVAALPRAVVLPVWEGREALIAALQRLLRMG
jgi:hypothetical protein